MRVGIERNMRGHDGGALRRRAKALLRRIFGVHACHYIYGRLVAQLFKILTFLDVGYTGLFHLEQA